MVQGSAVQRQAWRCVTLPKEVWHRRTRGLLLLLLLWQDAAGHLYEPQHVKLAIAVHHDNVPCQRTVYMQEHSSSSSGGSSGGYLEEDRGIAPPWACGMLVLVLLVLLLRVLLVLLLVVVVQRQLDSLGQR